MLYSISQFSLSLGRNKVSLPPSAEVLCLDIEGGAYGQAFYMSVKMRTSHSRDNYHRIFYVVRASESFSVKTGETFVHINSSKDDEGFLVHLFEIIPLKEGLNNAG